ncbi:Craniofacial development protein 2 [Eumeta japonica]|uniref:Craniofacial development protein 2 n=1 Tax=Eumeta variegata TaxID=151549 RepID=A0A4C1UUQ1_EUMVA|nr:Craniofacial development protein 2 [Eumeta japonica]
MLEELEKTLPPIKWDLIGLCEVKRLGEEIKEYSEYIFYFYSKTQGRYGMGFLVKKYLKDKIVSFHGISDRIFVLNIQLINSKQPWLIIQVHEPIEQDTKLAKEKFYNDLTELMQNNKKYVIVIGDFNAKVERKSNKDESVVGDYVRETRRRDRNDNRQKLIDFSFAHNFKIMNSFFKKRKSRKWT